MWGLRLVQNNYVPDGTGRDFGFCQHQEYVHGKQKPLPFLTACDGLNHPRRRTHLPKPPSKRRILQLNQGQWECSGQWASKARSSKAIGKSASDSLIGLKPEHASYGASIGSWDTARRPDFQYSPNSLTRWQQGSAHAAHHPTAALQSASSQMFRLSDATPGRIHRTVAPKVGSGERVEHAPLHKTVAAKVASEQYAWHEPLDRSVAHKVGSRDWDVSA
mmetsp:Transcript_24420/g.42731  ORF Transcript_24420/g.42731 Transcript_24420/m.42731 type:complete len:219 (-) Transcript_24420:119-775(-)